VNFFTSSSLSELLRDQPKALLLRIAKVRPHRNPLEKSLTTQHVDNVTSPSLASKKLLTEMEWQLPRESQW